VVNLLRQIEVAVANGKTTALACKEGEITEQTYYRWRKEYGGLQVDQARRLKELEQENAKLKRLVSELSLEIRLVSINRPRGASVLGYYSVRRYPNG
jgi:putative transposase